MSLIDCKLVIPSIKSYFEPIDKKQEMTLTVAQVKEVIDNIPTVDAAIVVHGKWMRNACGQMYCSACNEKPELAIEKPFCSSCGAKMDKGEAE